MKSMAISENSLLLLPDHCMIIWVTVKSQWEKVEEEAIYLKSSALRKSKCVCTFVFTIPDSGMWFLLQITIQRIQATSDGRWNWNLSFSCGSTSCYWGSVNRNIDFLQFLFVIQSGRGKWRCYGQVRWKNLNESIKQFWYGWKLSRFWWRQPLQLYWRPQSFTWKYSRKGFYFVLMSLQNILTKNGEDYLSAMNKN